MKYVLFWKYDSLTRPTFSPYLSMIEEIEVLAELTTDRKNVNLNPLDVFFFFRCLKISLYSLTPFRGNLLDPPILIIHSN